MPKCGGMQSNGVERRRAFGNGGLGLLWQEVTQNGWRTNPMSNTVISLSPFATCYASRDSFGAIDNAANSFLASQSLGRTPPIEEWRLWPPGTPKAYQNDCAVVATSHSWGKEDRDLYDSAYNSMRSSFIESAWTLSGSPPTGSAFGAPVCCAQIFHKLPKLHLLKIANATHNLLTNLLLPVLCICRDLKKWLDEWPLWPLSGPVGEIVSE